MRTTIQQLEDLKEWAQDSTRYERRLAWRGNWSGNMGTEAGTIPMEFDELSDREIEYYRTGPWSTREEYSKGQLVQPGPGRPGYAGDDHHSFKPLTTATEKAHYERQYGKKYNVDDWKINNLKELENRLSGWQLEAFKQSYAYKKEHGISLLQKKLIESKNQN